MAAIASTANGNWSVGATWVGGVAPTAADTVTITHTVTLDGVCDCLTGVVNSPGIIQVPNTMSTELRWKGPGKFQFNTGTSLRGDLSAAPTYTFKLRPQYGSASEDVNSHIKFMSGSVCSLKGAYRKRATRVQGAQATGSAGTRNITVDDATGWQIGDSILLVATEKGGVGVNKCDRLTITNITGGPTNAVITVDLAVTPIAYSKLDRAYIANESSNVMMTEEAGRTARMNINSSATGAVPGLLQDVAFIWRFNNRGYSGDGYGITIDGSYNTPQAFTGGGIINCAFSNSGQFNSAFMTLVNMYTPFLREDNLYTNSHSSSTGAIQGSSNSTTYSFGPDIRPMVFGTALYYLYSTRGGEAIDGVVGGSSGDGTAALDGTKFTRMKFFGLGQSGNAIGQSAIGCTFNECEFETEFAGITPYRFAYSSMIFSDVILENCLFNANYTNIIGSGSNIYTAPNRMFWKNKNQDSNQQEAYTLISGATPTFKRDTTLAYRGDASTMVQAIGTTFTPEHWTSFTAVPSTSYRVIGYVRYDNAAGDANPPQIKSNSPNVTITGTNVTSNIYTCPVGINTWNKFDLTISHSNTANIKLNLSYTARSSSASTVKAYFDGVPDDPWVQVARHYGFAFDSNVYRTTNLSVSASEATASAYTGITIGWGTTTSTSTLTADKTFQYLYDYTQYQACQSANMLSIPPLVGVGTAGAVSLFPNGNITTTGYTLNGSGSLSMGAYTLTGSIPWVYTYTGGTFGQVSTVPSFNGGTLSIGASGTYTFTMGGSTLVQVTPTAPSSYTFTSGSFTGTLTVNNLAAHAITVYVPAGTTTSDTGNTGGAITFAAPIVQQSVTITNVVAGSTVQIYDTTNSIELFNGTSGYSWTDSVAAVAPRDIRVRIAYMSGVTAKTFVEQAIGTCGITSPSNAISYLASQVADPVYNSNAVDGSLVTGITIVEGATDRVQISIAGGTIPWSDIYAYQCYWLTTSVGIQDDGAFISAPDTANYILTGFKIKNTHATVPLIITGGYGVDSTGSVGDLYDTTGTSIFPAPEHVVAKVVTVGGVNIITGDIADVAASVQTGMTNQGYTTTLATDLATTNTRVDKNLSDVGTGGYMRNGSEFNAQDRKLIKDTHEKVITLANTDLSEIDTKLNEIQSQNDIANDEIITTIGSIGKDLSKDNVATRQLIRQKAKKQEEFIQKQLDSEAKIQKMIEDEAEEIEELIEQNIDFEADEIEKQIKEQIDQEINEIESNQSNDGNNNGTEGEIQGTED